MSDDTIKDFIGHAEEITRLLESAMQYRDKQQLKEVANTLKRCAEKLKHLADAVEKNNRSVT